MFIIFLLLSHVVSWVRCGTWLYRYLIIAVFLTFNNGKSMNLCIEGFESSSSDAKTYFILTSLNVALIHAYFFVDVDFCDCCRMHVHNVKSHVLSACQMPWVYMCFYLVQKWLLIECDTAFDSIIDFITLNDYFVSIFEHVCQWGIIWGSCRTMFFEYRYNYVISTKMS